MTRAAARRTADWTRRVSAAAASGRGPLATEMTRGRGQRSGSHRRPAGDSHPGSPGSYPGIGEYPGTTGSPSRPGHHGLRGRPGHHGLRGRPGHHGLHGRPGLPSACRGGQRRCAPTAPRPGGRVTGPGGGDATLPGTARPATALPRAAQARAGGTPAVPRRARTPGAARTGGPARRSREDPGALRSAADHRPADRCGAPGRSAPRGRADAARSADFRLHPGRPTRCTRRASSRPGTHPRSVPSAPRGRPGRAAGSGPDPSEPEYFAAGGQRSVGRRHRHPDLGGTRRRPAG